jgi:hypothetical protein
MNLQTLFRPPLVWLVAIELLLLLATGVVVWHVWQVRQIPAQAALAPFEPAPRSSPGPGLGPALRPPRPSTAPSASPSGLGPTPGIRTDPEFLSRQMNELNRVEATFEDLEWRVTRAMVDAIQNYVKRVVLPSIERAEQGHQ